MLLVGRAGSGKSFIINCIRKQYPGLILVCAPTGKAAANIGGATLHALLLLPVGTKWNEEQLN